MLARQITTSVAGARSLLDSIDAVRNWRAVVLLLGTIVSTVLVLALGLYLGQASFLTMIFTLLAAGVAFYGANAVGMMMMDEANGHQSRPIGAAVIGSLVTSHRLILALLAIGVSYLIGLIAFALLLFVCKIPGIGPLLYTIVFPVGIVVSGIALFAIPAVIFPMAAPAIWNGAGTLAAVSQLMAVARKRLPLVLLLMIAVAIVAWFVAALIIAVLIGGTWFTGLLSAAVLGIGDAAGLSGIGTGLLGNVMSGGGPGGDLGGHVIAALIGGGILWAIAVTLPALVCLRGASSVYLRAIDGLDLAAEQEALRGRVAAAQAKAREIQAQAQATAHQYAQRPPAGTAVAAGAPAATVSPAVAVVVTGTPGCPICGTPGVAGDVFCATCGHKLA